LAPSCLRTVVIRPERRRVDRVCREDKENKSGKIAMLIYRLEVSSGLKTSGVGGFSA
jgi:hypothetical protein